MESILSLFIFHDTYVVSSLVVGITIIVVMLLLFNQKSPRHLVDTEFEGNDRLEGALRRVLGEQNWQAASGAPSGGASDSRMRELQDELLEKDQTIAELNKQITQGGGDGEGGGEGDNSDLLDKIADLEARLQEYEIIEDDIADLSLYKTENEKLKAELERLKALAGQGETSVPAEESSDDLEPTTETEVEPKTEEPVLEIQKVEKSGVVAVETLANEGVLNTDDNDEAPAETGADLVAEFEKVVSSQEMLSMEQGAADAVVEEPRNGKVMVTGDKLAEPSPQQQTHVPRNDDPDIHPKLRTVSPDSKEEAEVFISELKDLKKGGG